MSSVQLAQDVYEAFGRGDIPAVLDSSHPTWSGIRPKGIPSALTVPRGSGGTRSPRASSHRSARRGRSFTVTPRTFHDAGDTVVVEGRYTGVLKGSAQTIDAEFCHIWTTRGGKMRSFQQYMDTAQLQHAAAVGRTMSDGLLPIGMFSRASSLSIKSLRAYHEAGILVPAQVDTRTGYRNYTVDQLADAAIISRLRAARRPARPGTRGPACARPGVHASDPRRAPAHDGGAAARNRAHRRRAAVRARTGHAHARTCPRRRLRRTRSGSRASSPRPSSPIG